MELSSVSRLLMMCIILSSTTGSSGLTCRCDDGPQCVSGSCQATKNWFGPEHCQFVYDPAVNGDRSWGGCNVANFRCDIVSESQSVEATFKSGKLASFGGCCSEERCNENIMESKLAQYKNASCSILSSGDAGSTGPTPSTDTFSCHCDPEDMVALFDLSVERGVQWLPSAASNGQATSNASAMFDTSSQLRARMSSFCTNNMCSVNSMVSAGIAVPSNAFGVCARYVRATGKAIRGCTFVPLNPPQNGSSQHLQSEFPPNPIAGSYDVRVGLNSSERYNFIFECRSEMCNERQFYENVLNQCLPGVAMPPTATNAEPVVPGGGLGSAVETPVAVVPPVEAGGISPNNTASVGGETAASSPPIVESNGAVPIIQPGLETSVTAGNETAVMPDLQPPPMEGNGTVPFIPGGTETPPEEFPSMPLPPGEANGTSAGVPPLGVESTTVPSVSPVFIPEGPVTEINGSVPAVQPGGAETSTADVSGIELPPFEESSGEGAAVPTGNETSPVLMPEFELPPEGNGTMPEVPFAGEEAFTSGPDDLSFTGPEFIPDVSMEPFQFNGTAPIVEPGVEVSTTASLFPSNVQPGVEAPSSIVPPLQPFEGSGAVPNMEPGFAGVTGQDGGAVPTTAPSAPSETTISGSPQPPAGTNETVSGAAKDQTSASTKGGAANHAFYILYLIPVVLCASFQ